MSNRMIIVTGYFGAPIEETARKLATDKGLEYISLDEEITKRDGRSIKRLVMMNGEHGYRNQEYEVLQELCGDAVEAGAATEAPSETKTDTAAGLVIACGDGVLYDDDSREIALGKELVIAGEGMTTEELWENAKAAEDSYHAFMAFGTEDEKRAAFEELIRRQKILFDSIGGTTA